jgi:hypothetical protein
MSLIILDLKVRDIEISGNLTQNNSMLALDSTVQTLDSTVQTNTSTLSTDIQANTTTLSADVQTNTAAVQSNTTALSSNIQTVSTNILSNTTALSADVQANTATLSSNIQANTTAVQTVSTNILSNTTALSADVQANTTAVQTQSLSLSNTIYYNILSLDNSIQAYTTALSADVQTNTAAVQANTTTLSSNIQTVSADVQANTTALSADVQANTTTLSADVQANTTAILRTQILATEDVISPAMVVPLSRNILAAKNGTGNYENLRSDCCNNLNTAIITNEWTNLAISEIFEDTGDVVIIKPKTLIKFGRSADINGVAETLVTALAKDNLQTVYDELNALTFPAAATAPNGTFTPGNYQYAAAALGASITLDAGGVSSSVFVFRFNGAITTAATTTIILANGARASNVYWFTTTAGAITLSSSNQLYGTFISSAAMTVGAGGLITGRCTSLVGAVTTNTSAISVSPDNSFYELGIVQNFALFATSGAITNTGTSIITGDIGTNIGLITGFGAPSVITGITYISTDRLGTVTLGTVWRHGGDETYLSTNTIDRIVSTELTDASEVIIEGHTITGTDLTFVVQTVTMTGQTDVFLGTPLARISRVYNNGSVVLDGEITGFDTTGTSLFGKVTPFESIHITMSADEQQSQKCATSFSSTDYGILTQFKGGQSSKSDALVEFKLEVKRPNKVWRTMYQWGAQANTSIILNPYVVVPKNADVRVKAISNTSNLEVFASMHFLIAKII